MISREQAIELLNKYLKEEENIKKAIAVEAIMRKIAKRLNRDEKLWEITGLLHNIDYEYTKEDPEERGVISAKILTGILPEKGVNAIRGNNYMYTEYVPVKSIDKALIATISFTGLLFAILKSTSSQKLSELDLPTLYDKIDDEEYLQRFNRKRIRLINDTGINVQEYLKISLNALNEISDELGF